MKHAYLYSRVSTGAQTKGTGISRQDSRGAEICKEKGWTLVEDSLSDVGSAYTGENLLQGDLGRFKKAAEEGRLKPNPVLILEQWDRFSRQDVDTSFDTARNLLKLGVDIHVGFGAGRTFTQEDLKDIPSRLAMEISMQQAWEYSHNLSNRVNAAFKRKYELAASGKAVQFGAWQPAWIDFIGEAKQVGSFKKNKLADVVYGIVMDYINGKSMVGIAKRLNDEKQPCIGKSGKKGKRWSQGMVLYILTQKSLIGTITIQKQTFERYYPPVLTDDEFALLQSKLMEKAGKKGGSKPGTWIANLFPNRCKCSNCGGSVGTSNANPKKRYYFCKDSRLNKRKCDVRMMLPTSLIEEDFFLLFLKQHPSELLGKNTIGIQIQLSKVNASIKAVEQEQADVADLIGKFPVKALEKKMAEIQSRMDALTLERDELTKQLTSATDAPETILNIKKALKCEDGGYEFNEAAKQLESTLKEKSTREKLVKLLPSIIEHITIDFLKGSYTVTTKDGNTTKQRSVVDLPTIN